MDRFCMHFGGGSQALLGIATAIRGWVDAKGESQTRDEIITTIFSHPTNPAVAKLKGFKVITIYPDKNGLPDYEAMKAAVSSRTAAFMVTNAEDTGIFNPRIREYTDMVHSAGGLCSYDQANANGLFGVTRAREAGFDICFYNLHKTFSSPHGCGGPGSGVIGVREELLPFMPGPLVGRDARQDRYFLEQGGTGEDLRVKEYYGVLPAMVRAYAWIMSLGSEGLKEVSRVCVLNNNYFLKKVLEMPGTSAPYAEGKPRMEQVRFSLQRLREETGCGIADVQNRIFDFGLHIWTSHEPFIVPEPFTLEPTESYSKDELDEYLAALRHIIHEAYTTPEVLKEAPHRSCVHHIDHDYFDDPQKWAITWRAYRKKYDGYFQPKQGA
jgi:glycine dehydrogenase subunit 2